MRTLLKHLNFMGAVNVRPARRLMYIVYCTCKANMTLVSRGGAFLRYACGCAGSVSAQYEAESATCILPPTVLRTAHPQSLVLPSPLRHGSFIEPLCAAIAMDPITAFQVAASVITFVEFSRVLVSAAYTLYKPPTGQTAQVVQLSTVSNDLNHVRIQIERTITTFPATEIDHEILNLCEQCRTIGATLQSTIDGLTARGKTKLNFAKSSFVIAAKGLWKAGQVTELNDQLESIRSRIMFSMIASIWSVDVCDSIYIVRVLMIGAGVLRESGDSPTSKSTTNSILLPQTSTWS
jgi:hypothetical protein